MTNAHIYCRFSSSKQEKGNSLERQQRDNRAYCERQGWEVADEFADTGVSAWKDDNLTSGKLGEFANRVRAGEIESGSILCVEKLDRQSRQGVWVAVDWLRELTRRGLTITTSMDGRPPRQKGSFVGQSGADAGHHESVRAGHCRQPTARDDQQTGEVGLGR
ncbi:MAG: recombinase family protein [Phenylobacterium sp.]